MENNYNNTQNPTKSSLSSDRQGGTPTGQVSMSAATFKKGQPRWCPGCGDHSFLASLQKAMA